MSSAILQLKVRMLVLLFRVNETIESRSIYLTRLLVHSRTGVASTAAQNA